MFCFYNRHRSYGMCNQNRVFKDAPLQRFQLSDLVRTCRSLPFPRFWQGYKCPTDGKSTQHIDTRISNLNSQIKTWAAMIWTVDMVMCAMVLHHIPSTTHVTYWNVIKNCGRELFASVAVFCHFRKYEIFDYVTWASKTHMYSMKIFISIFENCNSNEKTMLQVRCYKWEAFGSHSFFPTNPSSRFPMSFSENVHLQ